VLLVDDDVVAIHVVFRLPLVGMNAPMVSIICCLRHSEQL